MERVIESNKDGKKEIGIETDTHIYREREQERERERKKDNTK